MGTLLSPPSLEGGTLQPNRWRRGKKEGRRKEGRDSLSPSVGGKCVDGAAGKTAVKATAGGGGPRRQRQQQQRRATTDKGGRETAAQKDGRKGLSRSLENFGGFRGVIVHDWLRLGDIFAKHQMDGLMDGGFRINFAPRAAAFAPPPRSNKSFPSSPALSAKALLPPFLPRSRNRNGKKQGGGGGREKGTPSSVSLRSRGVYVKREEGKKEKETASKTHKKTHTLAKTVAEGHAGGDLEVEVAVAATSEVAEAAAGIAAAERGRTDRQPRRRSRLAVRLSAVSERQSDCRNIVLMWELG